MLFFAQTYFIGYKYENFRCLRCYGVVPFQSFGSRVRSKPSGLGLQSFFLDFHVLCFEGLIFLHAAKAWACFFTFMK
jgi:hypothetical protein